MSHKTRTAFALDQQRRGLSANTIRTRGYVLEAFEQWVGGSLLHATTEQIQQWLDSCRLGPQSRCSYVAHLHAYYLFCTKTRLLKVDPTAGIERPRIPKRVARPLSEADLSVAIDLADRRMLAWLCLGAFAGFRRAEMAALRREDILDSNDPPEIIARGKGNKERVVPMNPHLWAALQNYGLPKRGYVFTVDGRPLQPATIGDAVAVYLRSRGIDRTCHKLRTTFGTTLFRLSKDLPLTAELMGHASMQTTSDYILTDPDDRARFVNQLGRRSQPRLPLT